MDIFLSLLKAFAVGGAICAVGQIIMDLTKLTPGRILVCFVVAGVALGGLGIYAPIAKWAGAGATVPLTGFGFAMVKGVREAIAERGALGILTGPLSASSAGITAFSAVLSRRLSQDLRKNEKNHLPYDNACSR